MRSSHSSRKLLRELRPLRTCGRGTADTRRARRTVPHTKGSRRGRSLSVGLIFSTQRNRSRAAPRSKSSALLHLLAPHVLFPTVGELSSITKGLDLPRRGLFRLLWPELENPHLPANKRAFFWPSERLNNVTPHICGVCSQPSCSPCRSLRDPCSRAGALELLST